MDTIRWTVSGLSGNLGQNLRDKGNFYKHLIRPKEPTKLSLVTDNAKKYKPNTEKAKRFLGSYLDPVYGMQFIMKELNISRSSYYRLVKDSKVPVYNLGLWSALEVPKSRIKDYYIYQTGKLNKNQQFNLALTRNLAKILGVRFNLKPITYGETIQSLLKRETDISITGLCNKKNSLSPIKFSNSFFEHNRPQGCLFKLKNPVTLRPQVKNSVGVILNSIHEDTFERYFGSNGYHRQSIKYTDKARKALDQGKVEYLFCHPSMVQNGFSDLLQIGPPINFDAETAVGVNPDNILALRLVNAGLEKLQDSGALLAIEKKYYFDN